MARIVFPSNPTVDQIYEAPNGRTWKWTGRRWQAFAAATPQTFEEEVTIQKELIITTEGTEYPGITIDRGQGEDNVYLFWDDNTESWKVKDTDEEHETKKIIVEYDTLDGGNY
jgi:hypothetical protein